MKRFITFLFSIISIFSIVYFTVKYYYNNTLTFGEDGIFGWTVLILIILATLIIGIVNNRELSIIRLQSVEIKEQNKEVKSQNTELLVIINRLLERQGDVRDEILETLQNNNEISLDIFNKIKKGD